MLLGLAWSQQQYIYSCLLVPIGIKFRIFSDSFVVMYGMPAGHLAFCIEIEGHHSAVYFNYMNLQDFNIVFLLTFTLINCATNIIIDKVNGLLELHDS